jgi:hypothetical protein
MQPFDIYARTLLYTQRQTQAMVYLSKHTPTTHSPTGERLVDFEKRPQAQDCPSFLRLGSFSDDATLPNTAE